MIAMTPELIGIITVGIALAGLIIGLVSWLRQDIDRLDKRIDNLAADLKEQAKEQTSFREEMIGRLSKLEGLLEGLREAITGKRAA